MAKEEAKKEEKAQEEAIQDINPKWLDGFTFRGATPKEVEEDGRKRMKYIPFERPLKPEDVLSFKDYGPHVVIVTKDGKKYTVKKGK